MSLLKRLQQEQSKAEGRTEQSVRPQAEERGTALGSRMAAARAQVETQRPVDPLLNLKNAVRERLVTEVEASALEKFTTAEEKTQLSRTISDVIDRVVEALGQHVTRTDRQRLLAEILDEVTGFGPINVLLLDDAISEVMVNGPQAVFVEKRGRIELTDVKFRDDRHVLQVIEKIVAPLGRRIDESSPMVDARLPDGSRVNAIIPPLALDGPTITIRKFSKDPLTVDDLIRFGSVTQEMADFLYACVQASLNIVVSGGTGSGKCVTHDTPVMLGDGRLVPIGEFVEARLAEGARRDSEGWEFAPGGGDVMSFAPDTGAIEPRPIEACWRHEAPEQLLEVELSSGARITVTPEHPFHTLAAGQIVTRRADELAVSEVVAVPTQVDLPGTPMDLFAALRDCRDLYVVDRQESVRAAVAALGGGRDRGDIVALAPQLGVASNTLRSWTNENAIPVAHFFDLMERAGRTDDIGSALNLKGRTAKNAIRVPRFATAKMWRLAGLIMGDGHVRAGYVEFHNTNPVLQRQFADIVASEFGLVAQFQPQSKRVDRSRVFSSALATLLRAAFGVPQGEKSRRLRLPSGATALPREHVAELLGGLFDTDGSVTGPADKAVIEFSTASAGLLSDVAYLLLRVGVRGRLSRRRVGGRLFVSGLGPLRRFAASVALHHPLKRARLEALRNSDAAANTNVDRFPGLATELEQLRLGAGATQQAWAERLGVSRRLVGFYESGERAPSRTVLTRVAQASAEPAAAQMGRLASMPILWDPIVRIRSLVDHGQRYVYDLTVAGSHTFIAGYGGVVAHNTTLLNVLSSFIPTDERIVTIEDAAELQLRQEHVVRLESRPPNIEGHGAITIRDLVRNALRMRPDRIVVGECRGGEALDMLQAMNTGHDGSLTTGHANSPRDMLARLETMVLMAGMDLPVRAIREQIASAVDLIVQQSRLRDGSRRVTRITEVQGMEGEVITLQDIFVFDQHGTDEDGKIIGSLRPTGIRPKFIENIEAEGIEIPLETFIPVAAERVK